MQADVQQSNRVPAHEVPLLAATRERVVTEIRQQVIDGTLKPGERLVERNLADQLGVSRSPVREAVRALTYEGFLVAETPRRIVVRRLSRRDVEDLYDVREAMETLATGLAARRATPEDVERLRDLLRETAEATNEEVLHTLNADFHEVLANLAANETLRNISVPLQGRMRWLFQQNEDWPRLLDEHTTLVDLIAAGDEVGARQFAAEHVRHSCTRAMEVLFPHDSEE